jgi:signal transduction histidine kinase
VPLDLAPLAAGFPLAASFAIAGGITAFREGRRRSALNEAVHELRRPLQVLALSLPGDPEADERVDCSLRTAAAAIERLDQAINGERRIEDEVPVLLEQTVAALVERWQPVAKLAGRPLELRWAAGDSLVSGSLSELERAVDNLISNAYEHGTGPVAVEAQVEAGLLRVTVRDGGARVPASPRPGGSAIRRRIDGRARHGHGLRIVRRAAARHAGRFRLCRGSAGTEAAIELPLLGARR